MQHLPDDQSAEAVTDEMDGIGITRFDEALQVSSIRLYITADTRITERHDRKAATPNPATQQSQRKAGHPQTVDTDNGFFLRFYRFRRQDFFLALLNKCAGTGVV
jgi:hypothetical protein